jgi:hypothetical protein
MPACLVEYQHSVRAGRDGCGYLGEVERHTLGVAAWQHQASTFALGRTDGPIDIGRRRPLVLGRRWPGPALGPSPRDTVLLANPGFILPPELYGRADWECRFDRCQLGGEVFLKAGMASASCV